MKGTLEPHLLDCLTWSEAAWVVGMMVVAWLTGYVVREFIRVVRGKA